MNDLKVLEEKLRECASIGDQDGMEECISQGANVNSQNKMNGWTALHWASKRGFPTITRFLVAKGADPSMVTHKGEAAIQLGDNPEVAKILTMAAGGAAVPERVESEPLPIKPNYLQNPPFPHTQSRVQRSTSRNQPNSNGLLPGRWVPPSAAGDDDELVLKVREAESSERDFIEVELSKSALTFEALMELCCTELQVDRDMVWKVRKLPNTIVRKDKDVRRLQNFQELELVTKKKPPFGATPYTVPMQNLCY